LPSGPPITETFQATQSLEDVYAKAAEFIQTPFKLSLTFPKKILDGDDRKKSLKDLGLVPNAALMALL
jgi:hypothetical protein